MKKNAEARAIYHLQSLFFKRLFFFILLVPLSIFSQIGFSQNIPSTSPQTPTTTLAAKIDSVLDAAPFHSAFEGVFIQRLRDGAVLYQRNADRVFLPASNNKILTSLAALMALGPDFTYHTQLLRIGHLTRDGVLHGDLILKGAGDPILSGTDLQELAQEARKAGIRRVLGALRYDDTLFDEQWYGDGWAWDDEPYYYSAQISALNVDENLITVHCFPGKKPGERVRLEITPLPSYVRVENSARTVPEKSANTLSCVRLEGQNVVRVSGDLPCGLPPNAYPSVQLTIDTPPRFAATLFMQEIQKSGVHMDHTIVIKGPPTPSNAVLVAEHISPPLATILGLMNKPSNNLIAECLLKTVGAKMMGKGTGGVDGTAVQSARALFEKVGMKMDEIHQADGSGLSRINFVSPRNIVIALTYLSAQPYFKVFYDSLPIAGVDGSLYARMKDTAAANNCHAKTGYVSQVNALSGYVTDKDGDMLVFSILFNNCLAPYSTCTIAEDKIIETLAEWKSPKSGH